MKRKILVSTLVLLLIGGSVSHAQIAVFDPATLIKNFALYIYEMQRTAIYGDQTQVMIRMAKRLVGLARYSIDRDTQPEWRPYIWWIEDGSFSRTFNQSLSYGDRSGLGVDSVTLPRENINGLSVEQQAYLRTQLAALDVTDSTLLQAVDAAGRVRFESRDEAEAIIAFDDDVIESDSENSTTHVAEKLAASSLIELRDQQATSQLLQAMLGLQLAEQQQLRETHTRAMNAQIQLLQSLVGEP